jgi:hypothetical protein
MEEDTNPSYEGRESDFDPAFVFQRWWTYPEIP